MWLVGSLLIVFWALQVVAVLLLKYGSTAPERWIPCFILGNVFGITGTWIWMLIFKQRIGSNTAMGLCAGGSFMLCQVALALVFRSHLSWLHAVGIGAVLCGMLCMCFAEGQRPADIEGRAAVVEQAAIRALVLSGVPGVEGTAASEEVSWSPPAPGADAPSPPRAAGPAAPPPVPAAAHPASESPP